MLLAGTAVTPLARFLSFNLFIIMPGVLGDSSLKGNVTWPCAWQLRVPRGRGAKEEQEAVAGAGAAAEGAGAVDAAVAAKAATRPPKLRRLRPDHLFSRLHLSQAVSPLFLGFSLGGAEARGRALLAARGSIVLLVDREASRRWQIVGGRKLENHTSSAATAAGYGWVDTAYASAQGLCKYK